MGIPARALSPASGPSFLRLYKDGPPFGLDDVEREGFMLTLVTGTMETTATNFTDRAAASSIESAVTRPYARRYLLVSPCRDEAKYARRTLDSIVRQSVLPAHWVIVDDGSKDETPAILKEYADKYPFIRVITRADRGDRKLGGGVIDAFYAGYDSVNPDDFDYVCKMDLDLDMPPRYFEELMARMEANPRIGASSGKPYYTRDGQLVSEKCGDETAVGMCKFYRTECFKQIGGFVRE